MSTSGPATVTEGERPQATSERVKGWVQYYEYFHKLTSDMQRTKQMGALRRRGTSTAAPPPPDGRSAASIFRQIAVAMKTLDSVIVTLGDDEKTDNGTETPKVVHNIRDEDLALIRTQLRAAAYASAHPLHAEEDSDDLLLEEAESSLLPNEPRKQKGARNQADSKDPSTCAAAIETLLWFGLALGEQPKEKGTSEQGDVEADELHTLGDLDSVSYEHLSLHEFGEDLLEIDNGSDEEVAAASSLSATPALALDLGWDWERALSEVGQSLKIKEEKPPGRDAPAQQSQRRAQEQQAVHTSKEVHALPSLEAIHFFDSEASSGDTSSTVSEATPSEDGTEDVSGEDQERCVTPQECNSTEAKAAKDYMSPNSERSNATRRSAREMRPTRTWGAEEATPLLKWEKEAAAREHKCGRGRKRRASEEPSSEEGSGADGKAGRSSSDRLPCPNTSDSILAFVQGKLASSGIPEPTEPHLAGGVGPSAAKQRRVSV